VTARPLRRSAGRRPELGAHSTSASLLGGALASALLIWHTAYWRAGTDLSTLPTSRRYWEDLTVAATRWLDRDGHAAKVSINSADGAELRLGFQRSLARAAGAEGLAAWEFWRTLEVRPALKGRRLLPRDSDDPGRAALLAAGFRLLRGVSPFLPLWIGTLAAVPLLPWTAWELARAGRPVAGVVFLLLLASSPFFVEALSLPYSAVGFYVIGLLLLVPFAANAVANAPRVKGLIARTLLAGAAFTVCVLARGGTLLTLPGFFLALGIAVTSLEARWPCRRRALAFAAAGGLFLAPYVLLRPPAHHDVWIALWEGLGDFDRTRGHTWADSAGKEVLRQAGIKLPERYPIFENTAEAEPLFRRLFLADVRSDPAWFAAILARRAWATLTQAKLRPWAPRDGVSIAPLSSPSEGAIDTYYAMTTPADWIGFGPWRCELPLSLLWGPTLLLILLFVLGRSVARLRPLATRLAPALLVLLCVAIAALGLPVLFTTAAGLETQAFVVVYFLGVAFLLDEALRYRRAAGLPAG
jgi:hypothetical protein